MEYEHITILSNGWVKHESQNQTRSFNPRAVNALRKMLWNGSGGEWIDIYFNNGSMRFEGKSAIEVYHFMSEYIKNHEN